MKNITLWFWFGEITGLIIGFGIALVLHTKWCSLIEHSVKPKKETK